MLSVLDTISDYLGYLLALPAVLVTQDYENGRLLAQHLLDMSEDKESVIQKLEEYVDGEGNFAYWSATPLERGFMSFMREVTFVNPQEQVRLI